MMDALIYWTKGLFKLPESSGLQLGSPGLQNVTNKSDLLWGGKTFPGLYSLS